MSELPDEYRKLVIVMLVALLIMTVFVGAFWKEMLGLKSTSTESVKWQDHWQGGYHYLDGGFDTDLYPGEKNEIFNKAQYVSGWIKLSGGEGSSEAITVAGKYKYSGLLGGALYSAKWYEYYIYWSDDGENWDLISGPGNTASFIVGENIGRKTIDYDYNGNEWAYLAPYSFQIKGTAKPYIKVEIKLHLSAIGGSKNLYAHDVAKMLSGEGSIEVMPDNNDDTPDVYEAGIDTVKFRVRTEHSGLSTGEPDKGWTLILKNPNGNEVKKWNVGDNEDTYIEWKIPSDAYKPTWSNQYRIEIYNSINKYDEYKFFVIDNVSLAPGKTTISFGKSVYTLGEQIKVTFEASPNKYTENPISYFLADIYYQDTGGYIHNDLKINADDNKATYYFQSERGDVEIVVKASAVDTQGRSSGYSINSVFVARKPVTVYKVGPGQLFSYRLDANISYLRFPDYKPEMIIYSFLDPSGKTVYEKKDTSFIKIYQGVSGEKQKWRIQDNVNFVVPAFAKQGDWTVVIKIVDKDAWIISDQILAKRSTTFTVVEGSFWQNMFAPLYYHRSIFMHDINWKLPSPATFTLIGVVLIGLILYIIFRKEQIIRMLKRKK